MIEGKQSHKNCSYLTDNILRPITNRNRLMPFTQIAAYSENDITHKYTMWTNFKATKRSSRQYRQLETYKYFKGFEITEPYFSSIPSTNPQFV